eukprot:1148471-Pyramimonas_sp.AAC.1
MMHSCTACFRNLPHDPLQAPSSTVRALRRAAAAYSPALSLQGPFIQARSPARSWDLLSGALPSRLPSPSACSQARCLGALSGALPTRHSRQTTVAHLVCSPRRALHSADSERTAAV